MGSGPRLDICAAEYLGCPDRKADGLSRVSQGDGAGSAQGVSGQRVRGAVIRRQNGVMTTDKHDDGVKPFDHPPRWFYAKTPRREIDFDTLDFRWISHHSDRQTRLSKFFVAISDFLSRLKRRQPKAQVNRLAEDAEPSSCASIYQPGSVTIACSKRPYTAGDKRFD